MPGAGVLSTHHSQERLLCLFKVEEDTEVDLET